MLGISPLHEVFGSFMGTQAGGVATGRIQAAAKYGGRVKFFPGLGQEACKTR